MCSFAGMCSLLTARHHPHVRWQGRVKHRATFVLKIQSLVVKVVFTESSLICANQSFHLTMTSHIHIAGH